METTLFVCGTQSVVRNVQEDTVCDNRRTPSIEMAKNWTVRNCYRFENVFILIFSFYFWQAKSDMRQLVRIKSNEQKYNKQTQRTN